MFPFLLVDIFLGITFLQLSASFQVVSRVGKLYQPGKAKTLLFSNSKCSAFEIEEGVTVNDLLPSNYYESQILSTITGWKGQRLVKYNFPAHNCTHEEWATTINQWSRTFSNSTYLRQIKPKVGEYDESSSFECDLYIKASIPSTRSLLAGSVLDLRKITDIHEGDIDGKWIFVETTQEPEYLLEKLAQLERSLYLLPRWDVAYSHGLDNVGSAIVLVNGDKKEFDKAMKLFRIPDGSMLSKLPVYVGWVPTRNIFSSFVGLEANVKDIASSQELMESSIWRLQGTSKELDNSIWRLWGSIRKSDGSTRRLEDSIRELESHVNIGGFVLFLMMTILWFK